MKKLIILFLLGIAMIITGFIFLLNDKEEEIVVEKPDEFNSEYTEVEVGHKFKESTIEEVIDILNNGTGAIFIGFPECPWCQAYAPILDEVAREVDINYVHYLNIKEDRSENTENYLKIVEKLEDYLSLDENNNPRIYVPSFVVVIDGEIIGFDDETSLDTGGFSDPDDYWTEEKINSLKFKIKPYLSVAVDNGCSSCDF